MTMESSKKTLSQFCLSKIKKWEQRDLVFTFLTRTFDNIFTRLNWGLKSFTPTKIPTIIIKQDDQSKFILVDFDTLHRFDIITELVFMDWYYQYSQKNLFDLSMYYWESLLEEHSEPDVLLLKCIHRIKKEIIHSRVCNQEYEDFYEDSNQRCNYSYKKIFDSLNKMGNHEGDAYESCKRTIKYEIEMLLNEENDHNPLANYILGIIFYNYREQNKKNQSLCFLNLLKSHKMGHDESTFTMGFLYFTGHCVVQNYQMALKLFKKAYEGGNHNASLYMGDMYLKAKGVKQDKSLSYQYLFHGSFEEHEQCIEYLKENIDSELFSSYELKYKQGDYTRCCYLGNMLFHGIAVAKSTIQAIEYWFLGLEHYNCQHCFLQISNYFRKNERIISSFQSLAKKGVPKYQQFCLNIKKYKLIDPQLIKD